MAPVPTSEISAKLILSTFKAHRVRIGEILMKATVNQEFRLEGGRPADYGDGLECAVKQGWITIEPTMLRLTKAGFAAM